ncbi:MAG: right-handed parallel beta-helix repeat-containing protein [Mycobacteriales bacterium]
MKARRALAVAAALLSLGAVGLHAQAAPAGHVILVCSGTAGCPRVPSGTTVYKSIAVGVSHAQNGDWVLVWPGYYREAVSVEPHQGLTSGLHLRGMQRSGVVLDGTHAAGSGVHVKDVDNTWVENMTGQHYKTGSSNAFYWTGVDGYWGNYLTAYDNGDYGIYAYDSTSSGETPSTFAFDYGSWNADSGIYIGGCRDCHAVITNSKAEKNAIGYSGTNAGGELYLINSEWDHNGSGIVPNTLTSEPDPPQDGATIAGNYIHDNNDTDVPGTGITAIAPVGMGVDLAGGWNNIVRHNLIANEKHSGVLMHWLFTPPVGNQVVYNTFVNTATAGSPGDADVSIDGTGLQNCIDHNVHRTGGTTGPATVDPPNPVGLTDCGASNPLRTNAGRGIYSPGDPLVSIMTALNAVGITEPKDYKGPGPRPEAQRSMANPCQGVPANPWCVNGRPVITPPSSPGR